MYVKKYNSQKKK